MIDSSTASHADNVFDIAEVARCTGLTSRALRFYEARGLVSPLRAQSGRRYYGAAELERVHQILALKRAGLTLAQIEKLSAGRRIDLSALIDAQLTALAAQARDIDDARYLLQSIQSRIDRSEPIDAATFCSLIRQGETIMSKEQDAWKDVTDRFMNDQAKADFAEAMPKMGSGFERHDFAERWSDLGSRIKAALPLDPASDEALGFVREWFKLLEPFSKVATPAMWEGARNMYANMDQWQSGDANPGFDAEVFQFIQQATAQARTAGKDFGPTPAWMNERGQ